MVWHLSKQVALPVDLIRPAKMVTSACAFLRTLRPISANIVGVLQSRSFASSPSSFAERKKTCLHAIHLSHGGKMCDFAGYSMPIQYEGEGITESHNHTRFVSSSCACSNFDHQGVLVLGCLGVGTTEREREREREETAENGKF